jgi:hypothetical protein
MRAEIANDNDLPPLAPEGPVSRVLLRKHKPGQVRSRCLVCKRWMVDEPTDNAPARRRPAPHAGRCTDCPRGPCYHSGPCGS